MKDNGIACYLSTTQLLTCDLVKNFGRLVYGERHLQPHWMRLASYALEEQTSHGVCLPARADASSYPNRM